MTKLTSKILCILIISISLAAAFESYFKLRLYKDVLQSTFTKNFKLILNRSAKQQEKDVFLQEVNAKMTNIDIKVQPKGGKWKDLQLEMFLDEGQIILEAHDLEFSGKGQI